VLKNLDHDHTDIVQRELGRDPPQMLVLDEPESAIAALNRAEAVSKSWFFPSSPGTIRHPSAHRVSARI
jgi:hypothetical protein